MIVKVCGIRSEENVHFLGKTNIKMVGLNFYPPSVRYINEDFDAQLFDVLPSQIKRVGVFVNETQSKILKLGQKFKLDYIQLHGDEDMDYCRALSNHYSIIKVFRVDENFDFQNIKECNFIDYYLFDTRTSLYGGSGKKFDWSKLNEYTGNIPFLLSGGIGPNDFAELLKMNHPQFKGIDINSKFESAPGIKDKALVLTFLENLTPS